MWKKFNDSHTNRLKLLTFWFQMENSGFVMDKSLEMTGVTTISEKITDSHQTQPERGADLDRPNHCNVAVCRNLHEQYLKNKSKMSTSPWHQLKSVFLVGIIMLLVMWVLVYAVCTWLELV